MTGGVTIGRVSTAAVPKPERFDFWEHSVSSSLQPVRMMPVDGCDGDFRVDVVKVVTAGATILSGVLDPFRSVVTSAHASARDASTISMTLQRSGGLSVEARGGKHELGVNTMLLQSDDEPTVHTHLARSSKVLMSVSTAQLSLPMASLRPLMFQPLRLDSAMCTLFADAARTAVSPARLDGSQLSDYLHGVAEVLLSTVSGQHVDRRATIAVRKQQARDVIRARISDPDLSTTTVAEELGMSTRRLQQIFAEETSVAQQIRELRIERARQILSDPTASSHSIASIAARCGFHNHAHFSRTFREATGTTPSGFRC